MPYVNVYLGGPCKHILGPSEPSELKGFFKRPFAKGSRSPTPSSIVFYNSWTGVPVPGQLLRSSLTYAFGRKFADKVCLKLDMTDSFLRGE